VSEPADAHLNKEKTLLSFAKTRTTLGAAAIILMSVAGSATASSVPQTATIELGGTSYTVRSVIGTFNDLSGILTNDPWWGAATNGVLAVEAAVEANFGGESANNGLPPFFVWRDNGNGTVGMFCQLACGGAFTKDSTWAWATTAEVDTPPIPVPASLPLLLAGLGAIGFLRSVRRGGSGRDL
jgi:hypothetical protein